MRNAYVGIANAGNLECLHAEDTHTVIFLLRRIERRQRAGDICFWAVIDTRFAAVIALELESGTHTQAFMLLQALANEVGRILPEFSDPVGEVLAE